METYEELLDSAYKKVKTVAIASERFEIPKVEGMVSGKNTIVTNIFAIATYLRRPVEHLAKFLQKELAVSGNIENDRLTLNTKLNSARVNEKIALYTKEFVLCNNCKKPDTEIIMDGSISLKHCLACGTKSPIKYSL